MAETLTRSLPETTPALPRSAATISAATLALMTLILLVVFASRITRLNGLNLEKDEVWSVWQTLGTAEQTVAWTPYDWSPAYYLLVFVWRALVGIHPFALRVLSILIMLVCTALVYRVGRKFAGERAGPAGSLAALAFAGFGYNLFLSTILRAYILNLALWFVALLLTLRYFETFNRQDRRTWGRALLLALTLTAMFYVHVTAIFAFVLLALIPLILYRLPIRDWFLRWLPPGLITGLLCLPEALSKLSVIPIKNRIVELYIPYQPPEIRLFKHYVDYGGQQIILWACLFVVAAALIIERHRLPRRALALILWMLAPLAVLFLGSAVDAFNPRHIPWVMGAFAVWIGWGLSLLPGAARLALAGVMMFVMLFDYIPINERYETVPRVPLVTSFNTLIQHYRGGDVLLVDPACKGCAPVDPEEWDYFSRAYFPNGLTFVRTPRPVAPRLWYVAAQGQEDPATLDTLEHSRALSRTFGEENLLFRLYEAPPDPTGVLFENGIRFNGAEILTDGGSMSAWHEGDTVRLRLWWSIDRAVELDYSVGAYVLDLDSGAVLSQADGPPLALNGPKETSRWVTGRYYLEEREIALPYPRQTGDVLIGLAVYQWWDGVRVTAPGLNADNVLIIGRIYVKSL